MPAITTPLGFGIRLAIAVALGIVMGSEGSSQSTERVF